MEKKVLAIVNNREITENELNSILMRMNPQQASQFYSAEGKNQLLNELIRQELLYSDAIDKKLDEEEEFKVIMEQIKVDYLKQYSLQSLFKTIEITVKNIKALYDKNK